MHTRMCPMSWWFPMFLFLLLPAAASGFSVQGVTLRVCSEFCSDGSCAPCSHGTEVSHTGLVSTDASSGHHHDLPTSRTMTLTLSLKRSGSEEAAARSPRQVPSTELSSSAERPGPDQLLTSFGHHPQLDTKDTSLDPNAQSRTGQTPVTTTNTPTGITLGDFATNEHPPGEFSFGFLDHREFHDITTSRMGNDVSPVNSKNTRQDTSPHPGAVDTAWGDFLDIVPAEAKTEKDSAPNEKLELPETATTDTPLERTSPASLSSRTESSADRTRVTGRLVLPDDAKKNLLTVPLHGGLPHPNPSGEDPASSEGKVNTTGQPVTDPGTTTSAVPVSHRPPEGEEEDSGRTAEEGGGRREGGDDGQGQLHAKQVVLLVAPCVGALLSVIGAVCVARSALANRCKRQKLISDTRYQHNQTNQDHPENELRTTQLGAEENARNDHRLY